MNVGKQRTIHPSWFGDDRLHEAEAALGDQYRGLLRLALLGLWCHADREGRFLWRPRPLGAAILPFDDCDFGRILDALEAAGYVERYDAYGWLPAFLHHQKPNHREAPSVIPAPPGVVVIDVPRIAPTPTEEPKRIAAPKKPKRSAQAPVAIGGVTCCNPGDAPFVDGAPTFLTNVSGVQWLLPQSLLDRWSEAYSFDVLAELRRASAWLEANAGKRKTARGMPSFLNRWLGRTQDTGARVPTVKPTQSRLMEI